MNVLEKYHAMLVEIRRAAECRGPLDATAQYVLRVVGYVAHDERPEAGANLVWCVVNLVALLRQRTCDRGLLFSTIFLLHAHAAMQKGQEDAVIACFEEVAELLGFDAVDLCNERTSGARKSAKSGMFCIVPYILPIGNPVNEGRTGT